MKLKFKSWHCRLRGHKWMILDTRVPRSGLLRLMCLRCHATGTEPVHFQFESCSLD